MIDRKIKILIFPAGSEIGLEIYNALRYNLHLEVFGASAKSDHAGYVYDKRHYTEGSFNVNTPGFISRFNVLLKKLDIDLILPTHDTVTLFLAKHAQQICAKTITSPFETALIAREKRLTYDRFKKFDFCPKIYSYPFVDVVFPVFLKPNIGEGGKKTCLVTNIQELLSNLKADKELIPCEYLPGEELSVDCFSNYGGELIFVGPRTRERITMGISFRSSAVALTPEIQRIAKAINSSVKIRGAWFFQIKKDKKNKWKLLEFAVRQASTMGLYRQVGINFALLSIFDAMGVKVSILKNNYSIGLDRCLMNRYHSDLQYRRVYIDFDDTIVIGNKVNLAAVSFLYQCKNKGVRVCLLTKHVADLADSLKRYALAENLFDEIVVIKPNDDKCRYIKPEGAIFIDNYFFDRLKASRKLSVPVFDVDAIESLLTD